MSEVTMSSCELAELVLVVGDVRAAARFYREVVGLEPEREVTDDWAWFITGDAASPSRIALARGPLLFEERSPLGPKVRWGPVHYALRIERAHLAASLARVRDGGVDVHGPVRLEWMRADSYYFYDPDGNLVEFWSPDDL